VLSKPALRNWVRILTVALVVPGSAWAQQVPDAGRILKETRPEPPARPAAPPPTVRPLPPEPTPAPAPQESAVKFELKGVRFVGNTVVSTEELNAIAAGKVGQEVTFRDLQEITAGVTQRYRSAGYFLGQAVVPAQEIKDGIVEISVIEGRLGKIRIERAEMNMGIIESGNYKSSSGIYDLRYSFGYHPRYLTTGTNCYYLFTFYSNRFTYRIIFVYCKHLAINNDKVGFFLIIVRG